MPKLIITLCLCVFSLNICLSQNALAKIEYAEAETDFQAGKYQESLEHLETVKDMLGSTNAKVMYLEVLSRVNILGIQGNQDVVTIQTYRIKQQNKINQVVQSQRIKNKALAKKEKRRKLGTELLVGKLGRLLVKNKEDRNAIKDSKNRREKNVRNIAMNSELSENDLPFDNLHMTTLEFLDNAKQILDLSEFYINNFEQDVPIDKLKEIYEANKLSQQNLVNIDDVIAGVKAYNNQDFGNAETSLAKACDAGNSIACMNLKRILLRKEKKERQLLVIDNIIEEMVPIQGGTFMMGGKVPKTEDNLQPLPEHEVIVDDYHIGQYEVTIEQYDAVMGQLPPYVSSVYYVSSLKPVNKITREMALEFIKQLNFKTGLTYRLPTEAEWEYAARGGSESDNHKYSGSNTAYNVANYNTDQFAFKGEKQPNELGIFDMSGNLIEWCSDIYESNYYESSPSKNPQGPQQGTSYVVRGGSFISEKNELEVIYRTGQDGTTAKYTNGFRLVLDAE